MLYCLYYFHAAPIESLILKTGVFLIENHIFPKKSFEESKWGPLPRWKGVPGFNILEHIYREEPNRKIYHPYKMIVQPR